MASQDRVLYDALPAGSKKKGPDVPALPQPNKKEGIIVKPSHLDRLPQEIQDEILDWYINQVPTRTMVLKLKEKGYSANHLQVWRWCRTKLRVPSDNSPSINMEDIRLEIEKKTVYGLLDVAMETIRKMKAPEIKNAKDFDHLSSAVSKLISAIAARERVEYEKGEAIRRVSEKLKAEFQKLMAGKPELVAQVFTLIEEAAGKVEL